MFDFQALSSKVCVVSFTKKTTGEKRIMLCTRNLEKVPEDKLPKGTGRPAKEGVQKVFDLEKNAWRSFCEETVFDFREATLEEIEKSKVVA